MKREWEGKKICMTYYILHKATARHSMNVTNMTKKIYFLTFITFLFITYHFFSTSFSFSLDLVLFLKQNLDYSYDLIRWKSPILWVNPSFITNMTSLVDYFLNLNQNFFCLLTLFAGLSYNLHHILLWLNNLLELGIKDKLRRCCDKATTTSQLD